MIEGHRMFIPVVHDILEHGTVNENVLRSLYKGNDVGQTDHGRKSTRKYSNTYIRKYYVEWFE